MPESPVAPPRQPVRFTIRFEPPLTAPGELFVVDEAGEEQRVATLCTEVTFEAAPGPIALRLCADGGEWRAALRTEASTWTWQLDGER